MPKCEFNVMTVLVYPIWFCTCIPGMCCSHCHVLWNCIFHTSLTFYLVLIYRACLSLLSTNV